VSGVCCPGPLSRTPSFIISAGWSKSGENRGSGLWAGLRLAVVVIIIMVTVVVVVLVFFVAFLLLEFFWSPRGLPIPFYSFLLYKVSKVYHSIALLFALVSSLDGLALRLSLSGLILVYWCCLRFCHLFIVVSSGSCFSTVLWWF
jgi:hypothetical protein